MTEHLCKCGCGQKIIIRPHHKYCGIPNFINRGHSTRGHNLVEKVQWKCLQCNREKLLLPCNAKIRKFCSINCYNKYQQTHPNNGTFQKGRDGTEISLRMKKTWENLSSTLRIMRPKKIIIKHFCKCGCGQKIIERPYHKYYNAVFIKGHSRRGSNSPIKGKTKETYEPLMKASQKLTGRITPIETRQKQSAKKQGINIKNWIGFSRGEYNQEFDEQFKESIRERDGRCCAICNELEENLNEKLSVHHIDYNKKNSIPQNCVILCRKHHSPTNVNRGHWIKFFHSLLTERCGYEYGEDGNIIIDLNKIKEKQVW